MHCTRVRSRKKTVLAKRKEMTASKREKEMEREKFERTQLETIKIRIKREANQMKNIIIKFVVSRILSFHKLATVTIHIFNFFQFVRHHFLLVLVDDRFPRFRQKTKKMWATSSPSTRETDKNQRNRRVEHV